MVVEIASDHHQVRHRGLKSEEGLKDGSMLRRGKVNTPEADSVRAPSSNDLEGAAGIQRPRGDEGPPMGKKDSHAPGRSLAGGGQAGEAWIVAPGKNRCHWAALESIQCVS